MCPEATISILSSTNKWKQKFKVALVLWKQQFNTSTWNAVQLRASLFVSQEDVAWGPTAFIFWSSENCSKRLAEASELKVEAMDVMEGKGLNIPQIITTPEPNNLTVPELR